MWGAGCCPAVSVSAWWVSLLGVLGVSVAAWWCRPCCVYWLGGCLLYSWLVLGAVLLRGVLDVCLLLCLSLLLKVGKRERRKNKIKINIPTQNIIYPPLKVVYIILLNLPTERKRETNQIRLFPLYPLCFQYVTKYVYFSY